MKHFIENELLVLFKLRPLRLRDRSACIKTGVPRGQSFSTANLLVQRREGQQRLQRVALRWFRGIFLTIIGNGGGALLLQTGRYTDPGERSGYFQVRLGGGGCHLRTVHL